MTETGVRPAATAAGREDRDRLYIDGAWVPSTGAGRIEVLSASTEAVLGSVPEGTPEDVDRAVRAAARAFATWSQTGVEERTQYLEKISQGLAARIDLYARSYE